MKRTWMMPPMWLGVLLCLSVALQEAHPIQCPAAGTQVRICVKNPTNTVVSGITVSGQYVENELTCTSGSPSYSEYLGPIQAGATLCVETTDGNGLVTGMWVHRINVPTTGQDQYQQQPVMFTAGGPSAFARVDWTYFPNIVAVNVAGDSGTCVSTCTTNCTLRQAIKRANTLSGGQSSPVLVRFEASPGAMVTQNCDLQLAGQGYITIDGTDPNGDPWIVGDSNAAGKGSQDAFPRTVDLAGINSILFVSGNNTLKGLRIMNTLPPGTTQARNLVGVDGSNNRVEAVKIDGGNTVDCFPQVSGCDLSRDLFNVRSGTDLQQNPGVTLVNVEGSSGLDKGIKSTGRSSGAGWAIVRDSWLHNNYRGGLQATLGGNMRAERNFVEEAGFRLGDREQVNDGANGLALNGTASGTPTPVMLTDGNVSRNNVLRGLSADGAVHLNMAGDYLCGNRVNGLGVPAATPGREPAIRATGLGAVYNGASVGPGTPTPVGGRGVSLAGFNSANFGNQTPTPGATPNPGNNAFASNQSCDFENAKANTTIPAQNNQWDSSPPGTCGAGSVVTSPVQVPAAVTNFSLDTSQPMVPRNVIIKGQTIRVRGTGFNAITGNPAAPAANCALGVQDIANSCCRKPDKSNTCAGTHVAAEGNCVELQDSLGNMKPLSVTSVTPTTIVTEIPESSTAVNAVFNCIGEQGEGVWVTKKDPGGTDRFISSPYCTNL